MYVGEQLCDITYGVVTSINVIDMLRKPSDIAGYVRHLIPRVFIDNDQPVRSEVIMFKSDRHMLCF